VAGPTGWLKSAPDVRAKYPVPDTAVAQTLKLIRVDTGNLHLTEFKRVVQLQRTNWSQGHIALEGQGKEGQIPGLRTAHGHTPP